MIEFQINKKEYTIKELTISDYYEIEPLLKLDDIESKFKIISGLSKAQVKELKKIDYSDWNLLWATLEKIISLYFSENIGEIIDEFEYNGVQYGLVKMDKVTIGEFADLDILVNQENSKNNLHKILAILYRPIVSRGLFRKKILEYEKIDFEEQSDLFKDLPLKYVKSSLSFFLLLGSRSLTNTLDSLVKEIRSNKNLPVPDKLKILAIVRELLEDGGNLLTYSPEKIQQKTKKLQDLLSTRDLTGFPGSTTKLKKQTK